ncbi:MAG: hypothetical protein E7295_09550 [Lachnospiraceae bacterium]|jgi:hypothetical protein|nr:hypothetical protein [Lachnospiraceae bacterium]
MNGHGIRDDGHGSHGCVHGFRDDGHGSRGCGHGFRDDGHGSRGYDHGIRDDHEFRDFPAWHPPLGSKCFWQIFCMGCMPTFILHSF